MPTAAASTRALTTSCDITFPNTGTIGYMTLLSGSLTANLTLTNVDVSTDTFTSASAHNLTTGSRVRISSTGTYPAPLVAATDYFAIVVTATTFQLAATITDALASTAINLTSNGGGTITVDEQALTSNDPITVLLAKEVSHPALPSRLAITNVGASSISAGVAVKPNYNLAITNSSGSGLSYQHNLVMIGAGVAATIGSVPTGNVADYLASEPSNTLINIGDTRTFTLSPRIRAA